MKLEKDIYHGDEMKFDLNLQFWNGKHVMKKALISYVSPLASEGEKWGVGLK